MLFLMSECHIVQQLLASHVPVTLCNMCMCVCLGFDVFDRMPTAGLTFEYIIVEHHVMQCSA